MDHLGYVLRVHFIQRKQNYFFRAACMMERTYNIWGTMNNWNWLSLRNSVNYLSLAHLLLLLAQELISQNYGVSSLAWMTLVQTMDYCTNCK